MHRRDTDGVQKHLAWIDLHFESLFSARRTLLRGKQSVVLHLAWSWAKPRIGRKKISKGKVTRMPRAETAFFAS